MAFSRKEKLNNDLGKILKQRRVMVPLTLRELAVTSGVSSSHLGRIERGERFPSAHILRRIAKPLGCEETELLTLAGYLSHQPSSGVERPSVGQLDPYVVNLLSQEPLEVQRIVIAILSILKSMTKGITQTES
jgi:transcriptional regulator with XRE-family HTH domain